MTSNMVVHPDENYLFTKSTVVPLILFSLFDSKVLFLFGQQLYQASFPAYKTHVST